MSEVLCSSFVGLAGDLGLQILVGPHDFVIVGELRVRSRLVLELDCARDTFLLRDFVDKNVEAVVVRGAADVPSVAGAQSL